MTIPLVAEGPSDRSLGLGVRQEALYKTVRDLPRFGSAKCLNFQGPLDPLGSTTLLMQILGAALSRVDGRHLAAHAGIGSDITVCPPDCSIACTLVLCDRACLWDVTNTRDGQP